MGKEIEHKFLVNHTQWECLEKPEGLRCRQAYLSVEPDRTIRVRIMGDKAWLTIKGKAQGLARPEFEYEIPVPEATEMMALFTDKEIDKTRFHIPHAGKTWEVDVFAGKNEGLIVAEIELNSETEHFEIPDWVLDDVSDDLRYTNSNLLQHPWSKWGKK